MDEKSKLEKKSGFMLAAMKWWQRLQQRMDELGWSKAELSRESGISYDSINKYLRGDIDQPRGNVLEVLARCIDRPLLWLRDGIEIAGGAELVADRRSAAPVAVAGTVEAGAFREVDDLDQSDLEFLYEPPDEKFPNARRMAFNVAGDSMNDLKPRPILPGDRAICVAYEDVMHQVPIIQGMVVVVERTKDGGQSREWSIKQVELYEDRTEFHPRSTNKRHKPIVIRRDYDADDGTSIEIIGILRKVTTDFPLS